MNDFSERRRAFLLGGLLALSVGGATLLAQALPRVAVKEVVDDRYGRDLGSSGLIVGLKLDGAEAGKYPEGRARLTAASDDGGRSLLPPKSAEPRFSNLVFGSGLRVVMTTPSRDSRSVNVSGTVELYCPSKDPAAVVKIPMGAQKLDAPIVSPGLAAANVKVTLLSKQGWKEEMKKQNGPEAMARLRAEMKKEGRSDEEIEESLETRKAFSPLDADEDAGEWVALLASEADMLKIRSVRVLEADGSEIASTRASGRSDGVNAIRRDRFVKAAGPGTTLVLSLLTDASSVFVPFELKAVPLP